MVKGTGIEHLESFTVSGFELNEVNGKISLKTNYFYHNMLLKTKALPKALFLSHFLLINISNLIRLSRNVFLFLLISLKNYF